MRTLILVLWCAGCGCRDSDKTSKTGTIVDEDGDGIPDEDDCDDTNADAYPGAPEVCDGVDNDCDGLVDEGLDQTFYADTDGDSWGDEDAETTACAEPDGYTSESGDCDDGDEEINPDADEICDDVDNDCDGETDESGGTVYADRDGDGYGDGDLAIDSCDVGSGYVVQAGDCDDSDLNVHPDADEVCDGVDNDCDGSVDGDDAIGALTWYEDSDSDGYGDPDSAVTGCEAPAGYTDNSSDCNDSDDSAHPGADEICWDGVDNDCDGDQTGCTFPAEDAHARLLGETLEDYAGRCVAPAGDQDGDGLPDLLVAASRIDDGGEDAGGAYIVYGGVSGDVSLSTADAKISGQASTDFAGLACAGPGDVNGDGVDDVALGAYLHDGGTTSAGAAYVVFGPISGDVDLSAADGKMLGDDAADQAGSSIAGAGDANGDGSADLLVGAPYDDGGANNGGAVYLVLGPATGTLDLGDAQANFVGATRSDKAGTAVAGGGDVSGDGIPDFLVGAPEEDSGGTNAGAAYLVIGPTTGQVDLGSDTAMLAGLAASDKAGSALAMPGDLDGDGYDDLAIGAPYEDSGGSEAGIVYIMRGPITSSRDLSYAVATLLGEDTDVWAGSALAPAGDIDADGYDDLLVGAYRDGEVAHEAGAAYIVPGPIAGAADLSAASVKITGSTTTDYAGSALAGVGDVDGDGWGDVLVGAYLDDTTDTDAGAAYLILGDAL